MEIERAILFFPKLDGKNRKSCNACKQKYYPNLFQPVITLKETEIYAIRLRVEKTLVWTYDFFYVF